MFESIIFGYIPGNRLTYRRSAGFKFARQEGSHRSYTKPGLTRPIVIPTYDGIPLSIVKNNLKTAGISREEYFRLLEQE